MAKIKLDKTALEILDYILNNPSGTAREYTFKHIKKNKIALDYLVLKKALKRIGEYSVKIDNNFMDIYRTLNQQSINENHLKLLEKQTYFNKVIAVTGSVIAIVIVINFLRVAFQWDFAQIHDILKFGILILVGMFLGFVLSFLSRHMKKK